MTPEYFCREVLQPDFWKLFFASNKELLRSLPRADYGREDKRTCLCGSIVRVDYASRHMRTARHVKWVEGVCPPDRPQAELRPSDA